MALKNSTIQKELLTLFLKRFETESNSSSVKVYLYGQTPISFGERLFSFVYVYKQYTNDSNLTHDIYERFSEQYEHLLSKEVYFLYTF